MTRLKAESLPGWSAVLLLSALLLQFPLAWWKTAAVTVPLFGEVAGVDFSVLALLGLGPVLCSGFSCFWPESVWWCSCSSRFLSAGIPAIF